MELYAWRFWTGRDSLIDFSELSPPRVTGAMRGNVERRSLSFVSALLQEITPFENRFDYEQFQVDST